MPQLTRLAAFAKKNAGRLATGAVVCLCAAALLLPGVLGAARQAQLLGQVQPRPAVAGVPSEQARSIPLLYDLYRRQAGDPLPQADTAAEAGEAAAVAADLAGRLRALAGAGLLTDAQRDAVLRLLAELPGRPDANILSGGDGSFAGPSLRPAGLCRPLGYRAAERWAGSLAASPPNSTPILNQQGDGGGGS